MKAKIIKNVSKRMMSACLAVAMIVSGMVIVPRDAEAADTTSTPATEVFWDDETTGEAKYVITDYWNETATESVRKVPVKEGYVFGGWYVSEEGQRVPLKEADLKEKGVASYENSAYAKFVPAEVLSIKTQAALGNKEAGETSSLRILSTVDSLNYQQVGFEYRLGGNGVAQTGKNNIAAITKVYSAIKPSKNATAEDLLYPDNEFVSGVSDYFIAADVSTIKSTSEEKIVYARPFWITMDGTEVMGLARNNRIIDKRNNNQYTSVAINLLTDGNAPAMVAAGKIQVTYNSKDYDVVGATADITADNTNGGKYLFSEMECHVNENGDTDKGTITFVGNADISNGELVNLLADGLFANVRFEKKTDTANTKVDLTINTTATEFCNWAEETVPTASFVVQ